MPTSKEHLSRALRNLEFAKSFNLDATPYLDWVVTAYFYSALHLVDAILADKDNFHPDNHEIRKDAVRTRWYLRPIALQYRELKDRSEDARYRLLTFTKIKIEKTVIPAHQTLLLHITQQLTK